MQFVYNVQWSRPQAGNQVTRETVTMANFKQGSCDIKVNKLGLISPKLWLSSTISFQLDYFESCARNVGSYLAMQNYPDVIILTDKGTSRMSDLFRLTIG
jgi:hypothetical protein